jgi:hypothetical protein
MARGTRYGAGDLKLDDLLPPAVRLTLARAMKQELSYSVRYLLSPERRLIVVLGEAHMKLGPASALGKEILGHFDLRGVETFPVHKVAAGRLLGPLIHWPRVSLERLSFGLIKGSTITDAKAMTTGRTFLLEESSHIPLGLHVASLYLSAFFFVFWLHVALSIARALAMPVAVPLVLVDLAARMFSLHMLAIVPAFLCRRWSGSWLIHPAIAILTQRDVTMAEGTVAMLREVPEPRSAVVIMGRAHLAGYERELVEKHGFVRLD